MNRSFRILLCFLFSINTLCLISSQNLQSNEIIKVSSKSYTIESLLKYLEEEKGIMFSYLSREIPLDKKVTLSSTELRLSDLLKEMWYETDIQFTITSRQVILKKTSRTGKKFTISGYVKEKFSDEFLIGASIYIPELQVGTISNNYGFYSITQSFTDSVTIIYSNLGYKQESITASLKADTDLNISLEPDTNNIDEIIVISEQSEKLSESATMSKANFSMAQMKNVPSLMGEKDLLKVYQVMPGIQKGNEGFSGLYVRGGGSDQNLIILDGATVYNANHLFGVFSLFNGDAIKSAELTKGGFPARYGGRLSSVIDMSMKEGNKKEWHGEAGVGLISSKFTIEGLLKKEKSSILLSARRTYADLILNPLMKNENEKFEYYFYDFSGKVNYDFGKRDKLYLSGYFGKDVYNETDIYNAVPGVYDKDHKIAFGWNNATSTLRWNHLFTNQIFTNTSLIYSKYRYNTFDKFIDDDNHSHSEYYSDIKDWTFKHDLDFIPGLRHYIKAGIIGTFHEFRPVAYFSNDYIDSTFERKFSSINGFESAFYIEDTWQPGEHLKINGGIRFCFYNVDKKNYNRLEPRLSAAWKFQDEMSIKASYAEMNQYIHLLSNTGMNLPTDLWVPATADFKPEQSRQTALGFVKDFSAKGISCSLEGYYKTMNNIIGYKEGESYLFFRSPGALLDLNWEEKTISGKSWSYGLEFLVQKKTGRLNGWAGYTLSWTKMQFDSLNFGREYYAQFDRRHNISLVGMYKIRNNITLSATWVFSSGNNLTMPVSKYLVPMHEGYPKDYHRAYLDQEVDAYNNKNNFRMPFYHRLDLGIQFSKKIRWGERTWEFSVYNAYNKLNPFIYYTDRGKLKRYSISPIIPSVSYILKF